MGKTFLEKPKRLEKLSRQDQENLLFDFINALVQTKSFADAALFLQDLLTKAEMKALAKRLRIAKLLLAGKTYEEIEKDLHTSHATIAKIAAWLQDRGDGFRKIIDLLPKQPKTKSWAEYSEWDKFKRRHSLYFWPELLLEEIVRSASKRQKEKLRNVLDQLEEKSKLHRELEQLLR